ncbi:MAG: hypothetical protein ACOYNN_00650 [Terrimicrobiaceae bacterium]
MTILIAPGLQMVTKESLLTLMKAAALVFFATLVTSFAQDFIAPSGDRREIVPQIEAPRPTIEGIVKQVFVTGKPWQMVNPLAPKEFGSGEKFVSKDFGPGTPVHSSTVTVAGVEW